MSYKNINILNNTMPFTFIYVENLITSRGWSQTRYWWCNGSTPHHTYQFYKLHPTITTFTLSGMTTVELSSIYFHSSSRLLLSAFSSSPSATTTTSSSLSNISSPASSISFRWFGGKIEWILRSEIFGKRKDCRQFDKYCFGIIYYINLLCTCVVKSFWYI